MIVNLFLNREITILQSKRFASVDDVIMKRRAINTPYGAPCTVHLKKDVRKEWERENPGHHIYVWGFDANEKERARRLVKAMPDYEHEFPLIEYGITKCEAHQFITKLGIRRPAMYDLGYSNNNCIGCVKGVCGIGIKYGKIFLRFLRGALSRSGKSDTAV